MFYNNSLFSSIFYIIYNFWNNEKISWCFKRNKPDSFSFHSLVVFSQEIYKVRFVFDLSGVCFFLIIFPLAKWLTNKIKNRIYSFSNWKLTCALGIASPDCRLESLRFFYRIESLNPNCQPLSRFLYTPGKHCRSSESNVTNVILNKIVTSLVYFE